MLTRLPLILCTLAVVTNLTIESAVAAPSPCRAQYDAVRRASSKLSSAENALDREVNRRASLADRLDVREMNHKWAIENAKANLRLAEDISRGNTTQCVVNTIFGGANLRCLGNAMFANRIRRSRAEQRVDIEISRLQNFQRYAASSMHRQQARIVRAQNQRQVAADSYNRAQVALAQCQAANPGA